MKRNCRRSEEERRIHEEAVRLRKMTDAQLVEALTPAAPEAVADVRLENLLAGLEAEKGVRVG